MRFIPYLVLYYDRLFLRHDKRKIDSCVGGSFCSWVFFAPPVQQAIAAVIATDVQCTACVGTSDLAGSAVTTAKIKDGEVKTEDIALSAIGSARIKDNDVKAQDIAPDAVGASELQGVSKLIFAQCGTSSIVGQKALEGGLIIARCTVNGADTDDSVLASMGGGFTDFCFDTGRAYVESSNTVAVWLRDHCETPDPITYNTNNPLAIIVYDK